MVAAPEVLAVVPARGGSKSIPGKNIRRFGGVPLIAYSIAAGQQSRQVTRVIVSTDSEEIAAVAREWGAEVPFLRPAELAMDHSLDLELFEHALRWLDEHEGYRPDLVVQLRPTTPLRPPDCVDRAVELMLSHPDADSVRSVVRSGQTPYKMWRLGPGEDAPMTPLLPDEGLVEPYNMPRQQLPDVYWHVGHVDVFRPATVLDQHSMSGRRIYPLVIDDDYSVDIDHESDWRQAEGMLRRHDLPWVEPRRPCGRRRRLPADVGLLVLDFDGVMTDDRVWVSADGTEWVAAHRGDGLGIEMVREHGVEVVVLSRETNPVVAARCRKLNVAYEHGLRDKAPVLERMLADRRLDRASVVYVGNDINDLECMRLVGCSVAVADAHPAVLAEADLVLSRPGGFGAVREVCDQIIESKNSETRRHA